MQACAKSPPDGSVVCSVIPDALTYNPLLFTNLPYDPDADFVPVTNLTLVPGLIAARPDAPFKSVKELIAYAKANPGKVNWGTWGAATIPEIYMNWIAHHAGVKITGIPYKGAGAGNPAVFSGEADVTYMGFGGAAPMIKAGKIKPIVAIGDRRSPFMPGLPTLADEGGDPGLKGYFGAFAPGKTPKPIVDRLNTELARAIRTPNSFVICVPSLSMVSSRCAQDSTGCGRLR